MTAHSPALFNLRLLAGTLIACLAFVGLTVAVTPAEAAQKRSLGTITLCIKQKAPRKGSIRFVQPKLKCQKGERRVMIVTSASKQGVLGIQGSSGPKGAQGELGPQGPIGPQGEQGIQGIQGPQGLIGPIGPSGTSVTAEEVGSGPECDDGGVKVYETGDPDNVLGYICNGSEGQSVNVEAAGAECSAGGFKFWLDDPETPSVVCNGTNGTNGTDGKDVVVTPVAGGEGCGAATGVQVEVQDSDTPHLICNGTNGTNGADGKSAVVAPVGEGEGCGDDITGIKVWVDGDAENAELICNGADGENGEDGKSVVLDTVGAGDDCPAGGVEVNVEGSEDPAKFVCNGEPGAAGLGTVTKREATGSSNKTAVAEVGCLEGEIATGGGHRLNGSGDNFVKETGLLESAPVGLSGNPPTGWKVRASTIGGDAFTITAYVICADVSGDEEEIEE